MNLAERIAPATPRLITVEEFLAMPDDGSGQVLELVHGRLRAQIPAGGTITLTSIGLELPLADAYRDTQLAGEA